jgi:hypothetical protein
MCAGVIRAGTALWMGFQETGCPTPIETETGNCREGVDRLFDKLGQFLAQYDCRCVR